ncbi:MAG: hypothetical protein O7F76_05330 [Planctomycetota bacterium]|nr:hypothetical protein [Planctomycetota bacterium]
MAAERNSFKVGLMTVVVGLIFFGILLWISRGVGGDTRTITIYFDAEPAMPGIAEGSSVLVGGQTVGKVLRAVLKKRETKSNDGADSYDVVVEAEIQEFIELRTDYKVFAEGPPLGGDGLIKIKLGTAQERFDLDQPLKGSPPGGFSAVLASMQGELNGDDPTSLLGQIKSQLDPGSDASLMAKLLSSMNDLNVISASIRTEFDPAQRASLLASIHTIMDNINSTTAALRAEFDAEKPSVLLGKVHLAMNTLNAGLETTKRILSDNESPIGSTLQHVQSTSEKLDMRIAENIAQQTDPAFADGLMYKLNLAATELEFALEDIHVVTKTAREIIVLNRENINKLLLNFKETSDHLKSAAKYVLQRPWRLLNAPSDTEDRQHAIFDAARNFAEAATRLDNAASQLRALSDMHDGNIPTHSPDLARIRAELVQTRAKFGQAEDKLWSQLGVR